MFFSKVKSILKNQIIQKIILLSLVIFSFVLLELQFALYLPVKINLSNSLFTLSIIILISSFIFYFKGKIRLILYVVCYLFFYLFLLTHIMYFGILNNIFGISEIFYSGEGAQYIKVILSLIDLKFIIFLILNLCIFITTIILMKNKNISLFKHNKLFIMVAIIISIIIRFLAITSLGDFALDNNWIAYSSVRSNYSKWTNRTECLQASGLFEYTIRDIYMLIKEQFSFNKTKKINDIKDYFKDNANDKEVNDYTGIFKDKNVIIIQLETIDTWLVNNKNMPTLTKLMKTGINFTNRYAPSWGGGNTFNTEYAVNTGLYIPVNGYNIYDSSKNYYPYSLANLFKNEGYHVNSIHFNQGYFYNRQEMHKTFGYDNHYALMDLGYDYHDVIDDEFLVDNSDIFNMIVSEEKFMSYVITYAAHVPYIDNELCENHYYKELNVLNDEELSCINTLSRISDNFIKKLINKLDNINKLEDTVLVFISDHYAYGYNSDYVEKIKGGSTKVELERVPFVIWSKDIERKEVNTYLDTSDILPTLANMFDLKYDHNQLLGTDVFSSYHDNYVYFNDYTWIGINDDISKEINKQVDINDNIIKYNYYFNK